jgi:hypothetical protein
MALLAPVEEPSTASKPEVGSSSGCTETGVSLFREPPEAMLLAGGGKACGGCIPKFSSGLRRP